MMQSLRRPSARLSLAVIIATVAFYLYGTLAPRSFGTMSASELLPSSLVAEIDKVRQEWGIKGAAIMVVKQEKGDGFDEWQEASTGLGQRDGNGNPMERDTLFAMASNAKLFTAIALGMIAHNESLSAISTPFRLETKVKDVIPEWKLMDPIATEQANFIDLLAHRTGLPGHLFSEIHDPHSDKLAGLRRLAHLRPSVEFREKIQYTSLGNYVASMVPERLYGIPFTRYVQDQILTPLGMSDTTYDPEVAASTGRRADGFVRVGRDLEAFAKDDGRDVTSAECQGVATNIGFWTKSKMTIAGQAGIISSPRDMATWLKMLLLEGRSPVTNETIIPPSVIQATNTPHAVFPEASTPHHPHIGSKTYGLGQFMYDYRNHRVIEHFGCVPGQMSRILRVPENGLGLVVMANDNEYGVTFIEVVYHMLLDHLLGLEPLDWTKRLQPDLVRAFEARIPPKRLLNAPLPDIALSAIEGTYVDKAYGTIQVCAVSSTIPGYVGPAQNELACKTTLESSPFRLSPDDLAIPTFIARVQNHWTNYLLFQHRHGSVFTVQPSSFYPDHNVSTTTPFQYFDATFREDGMAWNNVWGSWPDGERNRSSGNEKDVAEVWFGKVA